MKNEQSLYEVLTEKLRQQIKTGSIKYPDKLPSIRTMSEQVKMSKTTVIAAYEQLVAEGYLENREKSGFFVNQIHVPEEFDSHKTQRIDEVKVSYDFHLGQSNISEADFPHSNWKYCVNLALNSYDLQLVDDFGLVKLRQRIADYLYISRGVKTTYQQVVIGSGVQSLSVILTTLFVKKILAYENPGYSGIRSIFENSGYQIRPVDIETDGISVDQLSKTDFSAVFVSPSHQFPLGKILPVNKRYELIKIAN
ncbi:MAG: PLP-dependent aminotransferase family protein, partial [Calditrichaeota bacterium]|nr:PLP-dependent aminotransferase family protein [Calditrichota bacterium]